MPSQYQITEPHPSVPSSHYIHAGRGGAGNYAYVDPKQATSATEAQGPASRIKLSQPSSSNYYLAGRGGAGNIHLQRERAIFSFDEELERQRKMMEHQAPIYHIGRGGAGNAIDDMKSSRRSGSGSSVMSDDSQHSKIGAAWDKVRRLSKN